MAKLDTKVYRAIAQCVVDNFQLVDLSIQETEDGVQVLHDECPICEVKESCVGYGIYVDPEHYKVMQEAYGEDARPRVVVPRLDNARAKEMFKRIMLCYGDISVRDLSVIGVGLDREYGEKYGIIAAEAGGSELMRLADGKVLMKVGQYLFGTITLTSVTDKNLYVTVGVDEVATCNFLKTTLQLHSTDT